LQLKEIEIKGFKSFANKIKLTITPGITVIVGPNGCGKSNITDAVRWILGEQNIRSLRGNSLTDMIFSGSGDQKMRNVAQVSLIFDNIDRKLSIDSEEVEIKRVVYRSGETENYINGMSCKLRDIHELFWGTGLGRNSYSIIAQGKVDFVLNSKPSERRVLFEEAANISSYNNKKESALKKLELTENNLVRVNDILLEVSENLSYYQKKANDLKSYQFYRKQIKKLEFYLLSQQYILYKKNKLRYDKADDNLDNEIIIIEKRIKAIKEKIAENEKEKDTIEKELNNIERNLRKNEREINDLNKELTINKQTIRENNQKLATIEDDILSARKQYGKFADNLSDINSDIKKTEKNTKLLKNKFKKNNLLLNDFQKKLDYYNKIVSKKPGKDDLVVNKLNQYRKKMIEMETILKSIQTLLSDIERKKRVTEEEIVKSNEIKKQIDRNILFFEEKVRNFNREKIYLEKKINKNIFIIDKQENIIKNYNNEIVLRNKEKDFLEEIIRNNKTDKKGIGEIPKQIGDQNIDYVEDVFDIINKLPEQIDKLVKYLLKEKLPIIQFEKSETIPLVNEFLNDNSIATVKIISGDLIEKKILKKEKIISHCAEIYKNNILGFLNEFISCPPKYLTIFDSIFGNILVVKDLKTALCLLKKQREKINIASLDGGLIDMNGIITLNYNLNDELHYNEYIPRERIKVLNDEIELFKNKKVERNIELEKQKSELNELTKKYEKIKNELEICTLKIQNKNNTFFRNEKKINDLKRDLEYFNNNIKEEKEREKNLTREYIYTRSNFSKIEKYTYLLDSYSGIINRFINTCMDRIKQVKNNIENIERELDWNRERNRILEKQKAEMNYFVNNYENEKKQRQEKVLEIRENIIFLKSQEQEIKSKYEKKNEDIKKLSNDRTMKRNRIKEIERLIYKNRDDIENNQKKLDKIKDNHHENEMNIVQNNEKIRHLLNTIEGQYNSSLDEIMKFQESAKNKKEATKLINKYKNSISSMGQINFDAFQEYQNYFNRYNELNRKKEEIVKSKEKLITLINEIDRIAEAQFYQTYLKIENYFNQIFKKLFRGGQVSLALTNNKKLLETGIEVMVQPPGKKLQNISLLSTGEKALTAIALLFALWKANPSPFCFFDEIDSALDEANALRLATFFKNEDLKEAQIIVITHQKEIMEAADALYGITMEENGISKLMSVKMLDTEV